MKRLKYKNLIFCFLLAGCGNMELLAGTQVDFWSLFTRTRIDGYVDATGNTARFKRIVALAVDRQDRVYVADQGNARIRVITPQGQVSTVAGTDKPQSEFPAESSPLETQLVDLAGLTIHNDVLYFTVKGCVRNLDLTAPENERKLQTYYGKCLSSQDREKSNDEYERLNQKPDQLRFLGRIQHDKNGNLYVVAATTDTEGFLRNVPWLKDSLERDVVNKIDVQKKVSFQSSLTYNFVVDSTGCVVDLPDANNFGRRYIASDCRQQTSEGSFYGTPDKQDPRLEPYELNAIWMGNNDDLFIFGTWLAKLSFQGKITFITPLPNGLLTHMVLNPTETVVYTADETAVYRWKIPQSGGHLK
jgi:hypothetical protein